MVGSTKQGERGRKFNADALVLENMQENLIKKKKNPAYVRRKQRDQ